MLGVKKNNWGRRRFKFCYTAFCFEVHYRWGILPAEQELVVTGAKMLGRNSASFLAAGLDSQVASLSKAALLTASQRVHALIVVTSPDAFGANKLVTTDLAGCIPKALLVSGT